MRKPLLIASLIVAARTEAQVPARQACWTPEQHDIRSSANRLEYRLFVALPWGCSDTDTTRYAVLYVLDGNDTFPLVTAMRRYLQLGGAIPKIIVVGVGYPDTSYEDTRRYMDMTPSRDPVFDSVYRRSYVRPGDTTTRLTSGGAPAFLETLRRDIIPFIDRTYHTSSDRALLGHSFGGLFTAYALYAAPGLFTRYALFSPSTWWDNHQLLDQISNLKPRPGPTAARVFVAGGDAEPPRMRASADSVSALLTRVFGTSLTLADRRFAGTHMSYFPEALSPGLVFLYGNAAKK